MIVVSGTLTRVEGQLVLASGAGQEFKLVASPDEQSAWQQLQALSASAKVEISGRVGESDATSLSVLAVQQEH